MNAYELADQLKEYAGNNGYSHNDYADTMTQSANMLRQQADRIAELEECINACYAVQKMQAEEVYKGNDRIAELEKHLKKVQWALAQQTDILGEMGWHQVNKDGYTTPQTKPENIWTSCVACGQTVTSDLIHTCSPQTKPLSDEEIKELHKDWTRWIDGGYELQVVRFARAIEERHGIK